MTRPVAVEPMSVRQFFTPRALADYLALSERTVRDLLARGEIPSYKIAGSRRIDPADVETWLKNVRTAGKSGRSR